MTQLRITLTALILNCLPAQGQTESNFVDVTAKTGIDFVHSTPSKEKNWITEVNGSGVALFDADGDGDLDVYLVSCSRAGPDRDSNRFYENAGKWKFRDATESSGLGSTGQGSSACVADVDNDGDLDVYVTNRGPNALFLNDGKGHFTRTVSGAEDPSWSSSASFADFDRDGLVDLYVSNYIEFEPKAAKKRGAPECTYRGQNIFCGPGGLEPAKDRIYRNLGSGRFVDQSAAWGIDSVPASFSLGTLVVDIQQDGWPDLIVANDTKRNYCFLGGPKKLTEAGVFLGLAYNDYGVEQAGMGLASADLRALGRSDVFVTNFEDDTNTLYLGEPDGNYVESTFPAGLGTASYPYLGWGCFFFDADGDGRLDLFVANGHVAPQVDQVRASVGYRQSNQLFRSISATKFREDMVFRKQAENRKQSSRGAAFGDLDGDGDPDIVINNIDSAPTVLENRSPDASTRWLSIGLLGTRSNRSAIGARVVFATDDGRTQTRDVQSGMSYASQCELTPRFAISKGRKPRELRVRWPSGLHESFALKQNSLEFDAVEGKGRRLNEN